MMMMIIIIIIIIIIFSKLYRPTLMLSLFLLGEKQGRDLKLTSRLHLVRRLRMTGAIHHSPLHIHVVHRDKFTFMLYYYYYYLYR